MEIIKNDMSKEEIQHYVELLMSVPHGSFDKLTMPTLINMHNGLMANALAYNSLEDKYRELLQKGNYTPLAKKHKRQPRKPKNSAMQDAFNNGGRKK